MKIGQEKLSNPGRQEEDKNTDPLEQNRVSGEEEIKMAKRMWSSHPFMKTSNLHLHVEKFSLKTNWKLAEGLLYNQGYKKETYVIG